MNSPRVLISILNWNKASVTLACLKSFQHMLREAMTVDVVVLDNGSAPADYASLRDGVKGDGVQVLRVEKNLGFTGGHNVTLKLALEHGYDFVWLLNNDATVQSDTLAKLIEAIAADDRCGAVSPVICPEDDEALVNAWGLTHDWATRGNCWFPSAAESLRVHQTDPNSVCLAGTAILLRTQAIREVGLLDDRLFAYYDDNDIGTRLAHRGWRSKVVFNATATHGRRMLADQPLYYFYLMFRNELIFWHSNVPKQFRKLLWLRLVNQALFNVSRLRRKGLERQADSALLGVWDFIIGQGGAPDIARNAPLPMRLIARIAGRLHQKQLREHDVAEVAAA